MFGEPRVSTFQVKPVIATGNQPNRLVGVDVVEANRAFGLSHELFSGDNWQTVKVVGGKALAGDGLRRRRRIRVVNSGVPEKADIDDEESRHTKTRKEESEKNGI